jgi:hypothetical protein
LIIEGATEKVWEFIIRLELMYNKSCGFIEQNCIFEQNRKKAVVSLNKTVFLNTTERLKQEKSF